ncbi:hypothetical protein HDU93_000329, partial [Gonapodya sp. JEL0774]
MTASTEPLPNPHSTLELAHEIVQNLYISLSAEHYADAASLYAPDATVAVGRLKLPRSDGGAAEDSDNGENVDVDADVDAQTGKVAPVASRER